MELTRIFSFYFLFDGFNNLTNQLFSARFGSVNLEFIYRQIDQVNLTKTHNSARLSMASKWSKMFQQRETVGSCRLISPTSLKRLRPPIARHLFPQSSAWRYNAAFRELASVNSRSCSFINQVVGFKCALLTRIKWRRLDVSSISNNCRHFVALP